MKRYCYANSVENFLNENKNNWLKIMENNFREKHNLKLEQGQILAWEDSFDWLKKILVKIEEIKKNFNIIFEYELPYEGGRRIDVIILSNEKVFILEFKMKKNFLVEDIDQTIAYFRDIQEYHFESRNKKITPILVLTKSENKKPKRKKNITVCSINYLSEVIQRIVTKENKMNGKSLKNWIYSKYEPLPTIIEAARAIMKNEELPNIRRVNSTRIPTAMENLQNITIDAKKKKKHILVFVTGVPGAGKTYLGLQYVYDICESIKSVNSVYLSGNGSLIKVLSNTLGKNSNVFVKSIHKVINEYLEKGATDFDKNVIVFDEGQRAWDKERMNFKKKINRSEPDILIEITEKRLDWGVLVVLVGEGQEIYNGESSNLAHWNEAISKSEKKWEVICPERLTSIFKSSSNIIKNDNFDLDISLRSHLANKVSQFVNFLLNSDIEKAKELAPSILNSGFNMYVTHSFGKAKKYCFKRYSKNEKKYYGVMASSQAKYSENFKNKKNNTDINVVKWFSNKGSNYRIKRAISEFQCQGLEIDMPIIGWGEDMLWNEKEIKWENFDKNNEGDSLYRINSYRVLLTRGRDGFIIFVPEELPFVYEVLVEAGMEIL